VDSRTLWHVEPMHGDRMQAEAINSSDATTPAIHPIFLLHVFLHVEENARAEFSPLASSRGVVAEFRRIVFFLVDLLAIPLAFLV